MIPAVIFHSSGTTGNPKPIPTLHKHLTEILPCQNHERDLIFAFSTTPLYHGGLQDLFRALNSLTPICFFPLHLPVTFDNIYRSIVACSHPPDPSSSQSHNNLLTTLPLTRINVFLTVPYILRLMKDHQKGMEMLRDMKYVCFGGAALEGILGDELVANGVKLVSRYGSSESGCINSFFLNCLHYLLHSC